MNSSIYYYADEDSKLRPCSDGIPDFMITKEYQHYCADRGGFVLSNTLKSIPEGYEGKAEPIKGALSEVIEAIHR